MFLTSIQLVVASPFDGVARASLDVVARRRVVDSTTTTRVRVRVRVRVRAHTSPHQSFSPDDDVAIDVDVDDASRASANASNARRSFALYSPVRDDGRAHERARRRREASTSTSSANSNSNSNSNSSDVERGDHVRGERVVLGVRRVARVPARERRGAMRAVWTRHPDDDDERVRVELRPIVPSDRAVLEVRYRARARPRGDARAMRAVRRGDVDGGEPDGEDVSTTDDTDDASTERAFEEFAARVRAVRGVCADAAVSARGGERAMRVVRDGVERGDDERERCGRYAHEGGFE